MLFKVVFVAWEVPLMNASFVEYNSAIGRSFPLMLLLAESSIC